MVPASSGFHVFRGHLVWDTNELFHFCYFVYLMEPLQNLGGHVEWQEAEMHNLAVFTRCLHRDLKYVSLGTEE